MVHVYNDNRELTQQLENDGKESSDDTRRFHTNTIQSQ